MNWVILFFAFITSARAANPMNGGYVYECTKAGTTSIMSMDLYEAEALRGVVYNTTGSDEYKVAANAINRLKTIDPVRWKKYQDNLASFQSEVVFVPDAQVVPLPDTLLVVTPNNCVLKQLATIQDPYFTFDPRYVIGQDLWANMPVRERAAAILHLITLNETKSVKMPDSTGARYLSTLMLSDRLSTFSLKSYLTILQQVRLLEYNWNGANLVLKDSYHTLKPLQFHANGSIQQAHVDGEVTFKDGNVVEVRGVANFADNGTLLSAENTSSEWDWSWKRNGVAVTNTLSVYDMTFYPNGVLKNARPKQASSIKLGWSQLNLLYGSSSYAVSFYPDGSPQLLSATGVFDNRKLNGYIEFYQGGALKSLTLDEPSKESVNGVEGTQVTCDDYVVFYENGQLAKCRAAAEFRVLIQSGYHNMGNHPSSGVPVEFHENGRVKKAYVMNSNKVKVMVSGAWVDLHGNFVELDDTGNIIKYSRSVF